MNFERLKQAESAFFERFPEGLDSDEMKAIRKKHKPEKMQQMARDMFEPSCFENTDELLENMVKIVARSSMVSVFEKPKFRDFVRVLEGDEKKLLADGLFNMLHGNQAQGFEMMKAVLLRDKLAKWTLLTICPVYYYPRKEVFIKPTTVKGVISYFELEGLKYNPKPEYAFYTQYRDALAEMKSCVSESLTLDNAFFSGFLMMSIDPGRL